MLFRSSGNKSSSHPDELYSARLKIIRYFENRPGNDFEFYGPSWESSHFRNYKGTVKNKIQTLKNYRFCICFENIKNLKGYITEKITDCFIAGSVPIYWGASNITDYIPENCFIAREKFASMDALLSFLKNMPEAEYNQYLENTRRFLESKKAEKFSDEAVATSIAKVIVSSP